ncbi:MAG: YjbQ family protein [Acidobacteria bacterium]|nr:YjbQ family protein [Acidobacteriota bacterium]
MKATPASENQAASLDCYRNEGTVKVLAKTITVATQERTELINLSDELRAFVAEAGITDGYVQVTSLHTTAGLYVNEWQEALLHDVKTMIDTMVPREEYYKHNDPQFSDCDRFNADSHLKYVVLGRSLSIPISQGKLVLGQWQSIIFAEFDGSNSRKVFMQAFGI